MSVLISFAWKDDPYAGSSGTKPGPILALLSRRQFDFIYLLSTPATNAEARATAEAIAKRTDESRVELVSTGIEDPSDFEAILPVLGRRIEDIRRRHRGDEIFGFIAPGTQQMQASWLSLAERQWKEIRLLDLRATGHVSAEAPEIREINFRIVDRKVLPPRAHPSRSSGVLRSFDAEPSTRRLMEERDEGDFLLDAKLPPAAYAHPPAGSALDDFEAAASSGAPDYLAVANEIGIIGNEPCVREMLYTAYRYAQRSIPVLITGETGTGKDLLARYIQRLSPRSEFPYITMNCAAITASLAESELFGVRKGAYTGAVSDRVGKFGAADTGTLFLDEVGDLPLDIQAKLLRALENKEIQRVGDSRTQQVDVRVIAATNRDLHRLVSERGFRDDLLSRLSVGTVHVPPLRERRGDIPLIAQHLLGLANLNEGQTKKFTPEAVQLLTTSSWDRWNIRELRTAIERAWTMAEGESIEDHHFKMLKNKGNSGDDFPLPELGSDFDWQSFLDELRDRVFTKALEMGGGSASAAARLLGVSPQAVSQFQQQRKG